MSLRLAMIDKQIMRHIRMNGSTLDQAGKVLVLKFVQTALKNAEIRDAARQYNFTTEDLCAAYSIMVESLRPNPAIIAGGPMLAASLPFMEPFRIESLMGSVHQQIPPCSPLQERRELIAEMAEMHAAAVWNSHTDARGEAEFKIDSTGNGSPPSSGCGCLVLIGFVSLSFAGYNLLERLLA